MEMWIPVLVAVISGLLSYFASSVKSKKDIQQIKIENDNQLQMMREQHYAELEKIEKEHNISLEKIRAEFELKTASYDKEKESDVKYSVMETFMKQALTDPENATKGLQGLLDLAKVAEKYKTDKNKM